ncbi:MAG: hypothetical protein HQL32_08260 [Planctomycetes bacterium]|nr:hypothetical protein [Planctomycetota bacterium]
MFMDSQITEAQYSDLNAMGFFPSKEESRDSFFERVKHSLDWSEKLKNEDFRFEESKYILPQQNRLSSEELEAAGLHAKKAYNLLPSWIPAYYLNQGLPLLTGGMAIHFRSEKEGPWFSFFQLKEVFKNKKKWILYTAEEIVSHEMCHISRGPLHSTRYEENLAYKISSSPVRRYLGGALVNYYDSFILLFSLAFIFLFDFMCFFSPSLMTFQWCGKCPFMIILTLGLIRNHNIRRELKAAEEKLKLIFPLNYREILIRLDDQDILNVGQLSINGLEQWWHDIPCFRGEFLRNIYHPESPVNP